MIRSPFCGSTLLGGSSQRVFRIVPEGAPDERTVDHACTPHSCHEVGGVPLERLAARVGSTPFFAYDRAQLTERIRLLR